MKIVAFVAAATCIARNVVADLPIHCLPEDVLGRWTFVSDGASASDGTPAFCGHSSPNTAVSMLALVGDAPRREYVPPAQRQTFEVTLTNRVEGTGLDRRLLAIGPNNEKGQWTMVFDEGFEVRLGDSSFFAHFEFELLPGAEPGKADTLDKIGKFFGRADHHNLDVLPEKEVYACHCERTSIGWHSRLRSSAGGNSSSVRPRLQHGCFFAYRSPEESQVAEVKGHESATHVVGSGDAQETQRFVSARPAALRGFGNADNHNVTANAPTKAPQKKLLFAQAQDDSTLPPLPASWDWRDQPELSQPGDDLANEFDQGTCGSCYAFSGVLSLSMRFRIALSRKFGHASALDLSWRAVTRCSALNEGCNGGWSFLVGRHAMQMGVFQRTTTTTAGTPRPALRCAADADSELIEDQCQATCLRPDAGVQPVYFAADYGYVGGFSQGASEEAIMRDIYVYGPVVIELAVSAIPLLVGGSPGKVIATHNNARLAHDAIPGEVAKTRSEALPHHVRKLLGNQTEAAAFNDWLWTDHALLSVGWGETNTSQPDAKQDPTASRMMLGTPKQMSFIQANTPEIIKYWTIRNSWGEGWGNKGYAKLVRGQNAGGVEISAVWIRPDMSRLPDLPNASSLIEAEHATSGH